MFYRFAFSTLSCVMLCSSMLAQDGASPRELFYHYQAPHQPSAQTPPQGQKSTGGTMITATAAQPLALRYTITKFKRGVTPGENVAADGVFEKNDGVQLTISTNAEGYLYVLDQQSSGKWKRIFPSAKTPAGKNRIVASQAIKIPSDTGMWTLDDPPGEENLFVVFSRDPVSDFDTLIDSLPNKAAPSDAPVVEVADAAVSDEVIGRVRTIYKRDVREEPIRTDTPPDRSGAPKENAVYVANRPGRFGARLVADIHLRHP